MEFRAADPCIFFSGWANHALEAAHRIDPACVGTSTFRFIRSLSRDDGAGGSPRPGCSLFRVFFFGLNWWPNITSLHAALLPDWSKRFSLLFLLHDSGVCVRGRRTTMRVEGIRHQACTTDSHIVKGKRVLEFCEKNWRAPRVEITIASTAACMYCF